METVLIVEDDPALLTGLKDNFAYKGYKVLTAADGEKGLDAALNAKPDLILLDLMLPKINGYEICRLIRQEGLEMPIIMLTAKSEESDVVLGLNIGADDYVTKPFSINELLARAAAFLRRARKADTEDVIEFRDLRLDRAAHRLFRAGTEIELSPKEFNLLLYFVEKTGRALTRDEILNAVWGYDCIVTSRSVDRFVTTLRNKIEPDPANPVFIHTVRQVGYRFEPN
ncbi:MAG: response regulator transcription factor [Pontiellaceae bacterium]|nr:response regulator transcription factor [Pontiellaceae bacterium]MBN2784609.1 response regulator transcription factor [Pontiellaceae bacterium]